MRCLKLTALGFAARHKVPITRRVCHCECEEILKPRKKVSKKTYLQRFTCVARCSIAVRTAWFQAHICLFSILDHLDKLTPTKEKGKYICPVCEGTNLSVNSETGAWNCFNDTSEQHRAEIRNKIAPLSRWERPDRPAQKYTFNYENHAGDRVVEVVRNDFSGKKQIFQNFPTLEKGSSQRKTQIEEVRAQVLPYRYNEAIAMASATKQPVFIVEGELCADKVGNWTSRCYFPGGSGQYRTNGDYSSLFKNQKVVLCPDRDEPGVALMKEVASDNPGAQFLYADPDSFEWESLPSKAVTT